jgi:hypothetical protein
LIPFITRIPGTIKLENTTIESALQKPLKEWTLLDEKHRFQTFNLKQKGKTRPKKAYPQCVKKPERIMGTVNDNDTSVVGYIKMMAAKEGISMRQFYKKAS